MDLNALKRSNQTIAILGRFGKKAGIELLSNQELDKKKAINRESFFEAVEPALVTRYGDVAKIGDTTYATYKFCKASEFKEGDSWLQLTPRAELLKQAAYLTELKAQLKQGDIYRLYPTIQKIGLDLLKDALTRLDTIARYNYAEFHAAIATVARLFVAQRAPKIGKQNQTIQQSAAAWSNLLVSDAIIAAKAVNYILCYQDDEQSFKNELSRYLRADDAFKGEKALAVDAVMLSLGELKQFIETGTTSLDGQNEAEKAWAIMASGEDFRRQNWLKSFDESEYAKPGLPRNRLTFLAHAHEYVGARHQVQRLIRSTAMHPFFVCGLASKYGRLGNLGDLSETGKAIFELGVQGIAGRKYGESATDTKRAQVVVREAYAEVAKEIEKKLSPEQAQNYLALHELGKQIAIGEVNLSRAFTAEELQRHCTKLFTLLAQQTNGGIVQQILLKNEELRAKLFVFRGHALGLASQKVATPDEIASVLGDVARDDKESKAFVQQLVDTFKATKDLKLAFYRTWAKTTAYHFGNEYVAHKGEIGDAVKELIETYRQRLGIVRAWSSSGGGGAVATVGTRPQKDANKSQEGSKGREVVRAQKRELEIGKQVGIFITSRGKGPATGVCPLPSKIPGLRPNVPSTLKGSDGKELGTATPNGQGALLVTLEQGVPENQEGWQVLERDLAGSMAVTSEGEVEIGKYLPSGESSWTAAVGAHAIEEWRGLETKLINNMREEYIRADQDKGNVGKQLYQRTLRAWLLGEEGISAPPESTNIGKPDLSVGFGLLTQAASYFDPALPQQWATEPDAITTERITTSLDWSQVLPVSDEDGDQEIADYLQHQYELAVSLVEVGPALSELNALCNTIDQLKGTSLRLVAINHTLEEFVNLEDSDAAAAHLCSKFAPMCIYVSRLAEAGGSLPRFAEQIWKSFIDSKATALLPIVAGDVDGLNTLPCVPDSGLGRFPRLARKTEASGVRHKAGIEVEPLISPESGLLRVLSLMVGGDILGNTVPGPAMNALQEGLKQEYGIDFNDVAGDSLKDMFLRMWYQECMVAIARRATPSPQRGIFNQLLMAKICNVARLLWLDPGSKQIEKVYPGLLVSACKDKRAFSAAMGVQEVEDFAPSAMVVDLLGGGAELQTNHNVPIDKLSARFSVPPQTQKYALAEFTEVQWLSRVEAWLSSAPNNPPEPKE